MVKIKKKQAEELSYKIYEKQASIIDELVKKIETGNHNLATPYVTQLAMQLAIQEELKKVRKLI